MRGFILGVIVTIVVLFGIGLAIADLGYMPTTANATPPSMERRSSLSCRLRRPTDLRDCD